MPINLSFFDLDNTLYKGNRRHVILDFPPYLTSKGLFHSNAGKTIDELSRSYEDGTLDRDTFTLSVIKYYYSGLRGFEEAIVDKFAQEFWDEYSGEAWFRYSTDLVRLLNQYTDTVLVTGSPLEIVHYVDRTLGVGQIHATSGIVADGVYTGKFHIRNELATAGAKARLVNKITSDANYDPTKSFAFGDSESDFPLLESVYCRNAFLLTEKKRFREYGMDMGWNTISHDHDVVGRVALRLMECFPHDRRRLTSLVANLPD